MNKRTFRRDLARLVRSIRDNDIVGDCLAFEDDDTPGVRLTVGANRKGWSYQTGDNSFTGGAYGYVHWGVVGVHRDTNSFECADDIISQLEELGAFDKEEEK